MKEMTTTTIPLEEEELTESSIKKTAIDSFLEVSENYLKSKIESFVPYYEQHVRPLIPDLEVRETFIRNVDSAMKTYQRESETAGEDIVWLGQQVAVKLGNTFVGNVVRKSSSEVTSFIGLGKSEQELEVNDLEDRLSKVPVEIMETICKFLTMHHLGNLRKCSKLMSASLDPMGISGSRYWRKYWNLWIPDDSSTTIQTTTTKHPHLIYLSERLKHEEQELAHWTATAPLLTALKKVPIGFVVELSGNVGKFPSEKIARAVSYRRAVALTGAIVTHAGVGEIFRKSSNYKRSVSFMIANTPKESGAPRPPIFAKGFIGYAVDLIELRPHEEDLRDTCLASYVYRDLTVWETTGDVIGAIRNGEYASDDPFFCVLDQNEQDENEQLNRRRGVEGMMAPWGEFRRRIRFTEEPAQVVKELHERVAALRWGLVNCMI